MGWLYVLILFAVIAVPFGLVKLSERRRYLRTYDIAMASVLNEQEWISETELRKRLFVNFDDATMVIRRWLLKGWAARSGPAQHSPAQYAYIYKMTATGRVKADRLEAASQKLIHRQARKR